MRIKVPGAIQNLGSESLRPYFRNVSPYENIPYTKTIRGVCTEDDQYLWDEEPYWFNTHHRKINDVVHSKRLSDEKEVLAPTLVDESGNLFQSYLVHYDACLASSPGAVPERISGFPSRRLKQTGTASYWYQCWPNGGSGASPGNGWQSIRIHIYRCQRRNSWLNYDAVYELDQKLDFYVTVSGDWHLRGDPVYWSHNGNWRVSGRRTDYFDMFHLQKALERHFPVKGYYRQYWDPEIYEKNSYVLDYLEQYVEKVLLQGYMDHYAGWRRVTWYSPNVQLVIPPTLQPSARFLLHEDLIYAEGIDPYLVGDGKDTSGYFRNSLIQQAYLDALQSTPKLNDNSISNIIEIAGFIKGLVVDHKIEIPKSLGDLWLSYRYQYTTTKLDAKEAIEFVHRHRDLGTLDQWIHCFGASALEYERGGISATISCRCGLEIRPADVATLGRIWRALYTYGLQPNFYVIWDMIPYSFIVDWLIPIGRIASAWDASENYSGTYYEIKDVVFSLSYDVRDEYNNVYHQYTRWTQDRIDNLKGFYFLEEDPVSSKVIGMRILDTLSLFIGRRK